MTPRTNPEPGGDSRRHGLPLFTAFQSVSQRCVADLRQLSPFGVTPIAPEGLFQFRMRGTQSPYRPAAIMPPPRRGRAVFNLGSA